jgi:hypothetical protein
LRKYHFVVSDKLNIPTRKKESAAGVAPRHFFIELSEMLSGQIYEPDFGTDTASPKRLIHKCLNTPEHLVKLADTVSQNCANDDVIFCIGEAIALPVAYALKKKGKTTKLASFGHNLYRPRITVANILWGCLNRVDRFLVFTAAAEGRSGKNRLYFEQTDDRLFSPNPDQGNIKKPGAALEKPLIISIGLEKRDNMTLAKATVDLNVDVRITAFSRDAQPDPRASPDPMPSNMSSRFYPWRELVDLYRSADIVVVPVVPTNYAAGITSILEAAAVGRPIIATGNPALKDAVADQDIAAWVPPEDAAALRETLLNLLEHPATLASMGDKAKAIQAKHHGFASKIDEVIAELTAL